MAVFACFVIVVVVLFYAVLLWSASSPNEMGRSRSLLYYHYIIISNFPWIYYAMRGLVPVGRFRNISGHLFTWLVCGSFQWCNGLLFTDYIVWDDKDKVIGFKRSHWIQFGWWSTRSQKLVSIITAFTHHQLSTDIFFSLLSTKYDIKIQNAATSRFLR